MGRIDNVSWQVLNALLDELLEMPAAARAARLEQVEKDNAACARQAAALLAHQAAIEREHFLESPPIEHAELVRKQPKSPSRD